VVYSPFEQGGDAIELFADGIQLCRRVTQLENLVD
jgi:hypothetical protein